LYPSRTVCSEFMPPLLYRMPLPPVWRFYFDFFFFRSPSRPFPLQKDIGLFLCSLVSCAPPLVSLGRVAICVVFFQFFKSGFFCKQNWLCLLPLFTGRPFVGRSLHDGALNYSSSSRGLLPTFFGTSNPPLPFIHQCWVERCFFSSPPRCFFLVALSPSLLLRTILPYSLNL